MFLAGLFKYCTLIWALVRFQYEQKSKFETRDSNKAWPQFEKLRFQKRSFPLKMHIAKRVLHFKYAFLTA